MLRTPRVELCVALVGCAPASDAPPCFHYDVVFASRELTDLATLPDGVVVAVGSGRSDGGTWIARTHAGGSGPIVERPGRRIFATRSEGGDVFAIMDEPESSSLERDQPTLLEHVHEDDSPFEPIALDMGIDDVFAVQATPQGELLLHSLRSVVSVVTTDGELVGQWSNDDVVGAAAFDDGIAAVVRSLTSHDNAPIEIEWLSSDARPLAAARVDIPGRGGLGSMVGAGARVFAIAGGVDRFGRSTSSVGLLARDGSWHELASSDDPTDTQWNVLAVAPDGALVAAGHRPLDHTIDLRAWSDDGEPRWRIQFIRPSADGAAPYSDACRIGGPLRLAVADDGGIAIGGGDGCTFSWLRVFDP